MDAAEFLEMVAGERCPCGHKRHAHEDPHPGLDGDVMGKCHARGCDCMGVVDAREDSE